MYWIIQGLTTHFVETDSLRAPQLPEQVSHKYDDKYFLAEFLTNTALAAQMNCLESLGLGKAGLVALKESSNHRAITLRFESTQTCVTFS